MDELSLEDAYAEHATESLSIAEEWYPLCVESLTINVGMRHG